MAARGLTMHEVEEAGPLLEVDAASAPARRPMRRAIAGVAGLSACAAVIVALARGGPAARATTAAELRPAQKAQLYQHQTANTAASPPPDYDLREDGRQRVKIEDDLGSHISESDAPAHFRTGVVDPAGFAKEFFGHILNKSGLHHELTTTERQAFRDRFVDAMVARSKHEPGWVAGFPGFLMFLKSAKVVIEHSKPVVTHAFAQSINKARLGFKARMRPWMVHESQKAFAQRLGRPPLDSSVKAAAEQSQQNAKHQMRGRGAVPVQLPKSHDPRKRWPECSDVIGRPHNQGHCGSCWIFAALGAVDSRMCIYSGGRFSGKNATLSRGYTASCIVGEGNGCAGGWEYSVFQFMETTSGVPSASCSPYFAHGAGTEHFQQSGRSPPCPKTCDATYARSLDSDYFQPIGMASYELLLNPQENGGIEKAKTAMYEHGPISFGIWASRNFMAYASGVFSLDCGYSANHAVLALGWGDDYLLGQNSWGDEWGEAGLFRVAWCVPTDFTIPGPITQAKYPLPFPDKSIPPTTTTPEPAPPRWMSLCPSVENGCITSPSYPSMYPSDTSCIISYEFGKITVADFETEDEYDYLEVNGVQYSGKVGPNGVVPKTNIVWSSDFDGPARGWKICPDSSTP